jgi:glycosyltransferase involved in cell wall biosynthesis
MRARTSHWLSGSCKPVTDMAPPLRIGVNALYLIPGGVGGTEIYLRGLLSALAAIDPVNQYFIFTNRETGPDLVPKTNNFQHRPQPVRAEFRPARLVWEQTALPLDAVRLNLDVMFNPGFTAPLACPCPQVTVFHDLQHIRHPEYFRWFDLPFWEFFLFWSAQVSRLLLADSDATAEDLLRHYRLPASKVRVARLGVDPVFFELGRKRRPEPFLLAVSTLHPHKNLDGLLAAFAEFRKVHPEFSLVVCGIHGFFTGPLYDLRDSLGLARAVDFPGWIPREDLYDLYARAWAFVYPSLFEGFGLPVLEALAAGVPTACSNIEPVSSVAGDAALRFDPQNKEAMVDALERVMMESGLRTRLSKAGPIRAAQFSWRSTAESTLEALRAAVF